MSKIPTEANPTTLGSIDLTNCYTDYGFWPWAAFLPLAAGVYLNRPLGRFIARRLTDPSQAYRRELLPGWACGAIYRSSRERTAAYDGWLWHYDHHRSHSAIGRQPPITCLNNLLGSCT